MKVVRVIQCKECQHFEQDLWRTVDGVPLIVAYEICNFWGNGCRTNPEGYCFAGKERSSHEHNESERHKV